MGAVDAQETARPEVGPPGAIGHDGAYRVGNGVTPPTVLSRVSPDDSSALAKALRASGDVLISLVVRSDGTLHNIQVVKAVGYGMDERAVETVRKWRFKPGKKDGAPVDVRVQVEVAFRIAPDANAWGAGPLVFDAATGITPHVLRSGTMPKAAGKIGNEAVVIQFKVDSHGEVGDIRPLQGEKSVSLPVLLSSLAKWKFAPALSGSAPIPASGKVLLIKGEDQFRYEVSLSFRDSGSILAGHNTTDRSATSPVPENSKPAIVVVPVKLRLEPEEAKRQLVEQVAPKYPADAKQAGVQGTVILDVTVGVDGNVKEVREIDGPPELISAAVAAVKQWRYRPTVYRGRPWEVSTEVEVQFKLPE